MSRRLNGVYFNELQGNPFQADLNYRGYTASPLLGTPQGFSVYLDGVRQNQPFGDVVSWDLIQNNAIDSMTLMPGSNPLFGLNTLGGAISIQTKDGVASPGLAGELTYGSSGRKASRPRMAAAKRPASTGFSRRMHSMNRAGASNRPPMSGRASPNLDGTGKTSLALTLSYAYNTMTGNGLQDYRLLAATTPVFIPFPIPSTTALHP